MKLFFYLSFCVVFVSACKQHQTCRACIRDFKGCVWCASEKVSGQRCMSNNSMPENWCPEDIQNPTSSIDIAPRVSNRINPEAIAIKPQIIEMNLRPGQTVDFNFTYTPARNYPVDIYFLYDASMSKNFLKKLTVQTTTIINWIQSKTSNASIGFGTFIDKNALPFISIQNRSLSYSFKHHIKLSRDTENFKKTLAEVENELTDSIFIDNIHGGLDALAQAIVCEEIGWRDLSRKVIVLATDNSIHIAGDGKAAGIFNPYDGKCYMNNGVYTNELHMDYPSISMINKLASDQEVTIFFVIDDVEQDYDYIGDNIKGAHVIPSELNAQQHISIASKLQETYTSISETITMKKDINPIYKKKINVVLDPDCSDTSSDSSTECKVELEKEKTFRGQITVLEYFEADDIKVNISMIGIKEKLTLNIKLISECNCTAGDDKLCHGGGKRQCGVCACNPNRSGINCECSTTNATVNMDKSTCMEPKSQIECSGRGSCVCGFCKCAGKRYRGKYCDCDDEFCPKDNNGQLCGHGRCQCGECICEQGWTKNVQRTCNCETSNIMCRTGIYECSDYGRCECNKCECKSPFCEWDARSSQGPRCNPLPCEDCHFRQCLLLQPYALNDISNTACNKRVIVTPVQKLDNKTGWMTCSDVRTTIGCYTKFIYKYDDEKYGIHLMVQSENDCAESYYIYGGTCIGGLVLMGILTLAVWKVVTVHRDRKEYKRFLLQHQASMKRSAPQPNPVFNSAITSTTNPNYRRRSQFS